MSKGNLSPTEFLAIFVMFFGSVGFVLWGLGIGLNVAQADFLRYAGSIIVGTVGLLIAILERWFK